MSLIVIYIAGLLSGGMVAWRVDEWRDYKINRYEEILEIDRATDGRLLESRYLMKDPFGQVWIVETGGCSMVL